MFNDFYITFNTLFRTFIKLYSSIFKSKWVSYLRLSCGYKYWLFIHFVIQLIVFGYRSPWVNSWTSSLKRDILLFIYNFVGGGINVKYLRKHWHEMEMHEDLTHVLGAKLITWWFKHVQVGKQRFLNAVTTMLRCQSTLWANYCDCSWHWIFLLGQLVSLHNNIGLLIIYKRNTNTQIALISYDK